MLLKQVCDLYITPDPGIVLYFNAQVRHVFITFFKRDIAWQTPDGNTINHHTASGGIFIINGDGVAHLAQVARGSQASGTRTNDANTLVLRDRGSLRTMLILAVVSGGPLQPANSDRFTVDFVTATDRLAGASTGPSKDARYHVGFTVQKIRLVETSLGNQTNIGRNIGMSWTAYLARNIRLIPVRIRHD